MSETSRHDYIDMRLTKLSSLTHRLARPSKGMRLHISPSVSDTSPISYTFSPQQSSDAAPMLQYSCEKTVESKYKVSPVERIL